MSLKIMENFSKKNVYKTQPQIEKKQKKTNQCRHSSETICSI